MRTKLIDLDAELKKAIARLREMAQDGLAPGQKTYNAQRGASCASTDWFYKAGVPYSELVRRAGLRQRSPGVQTTAEDRIAVAVARLRELAQDGVAPGYREYNDLRGDAISREAICAYISWAEFVERAGLQMPRDGESEAVPEEVEAEIAAAFARGDHLPNHYRDWPLSAIPTKVERFIVPLPDGSGYRITRYYASIK